MVLMKLARGKREVKREVDRIKQGKTARGVSCFLTRRPHVRANTFTSATTLTSASPASTMRSTLSSNLPRTRTGNPAPSAMLPIRARLRTAFTTRTRMVRPLASSPEVGNV